MRSVMLSQFQSAPGSAEQANRRMSPRRLWTAVLLVALVSCSGRRLVASGSVPADAKLAMAPTNSWEASVFEDAVRHAGLALVSGECATALVHVTFNTTAGRAAEQGSATRWLFGGNLTNHRDGGKGLWFGLGGAAVAEDGVPAADNSTRAILAMAVVERGSGKPLWTGSVIEDEWAGRAPPAQAEWIRQSARLLARKCRR